MAHDPRCLRRSSLTSDVHDKIVRLNDIAAGRGQALAEMALAWQLRDPDVTSVLVGASRPEQVLDNIRALDSCAFSDGELAAIDEASGFARKPSLAGRCVTFSIRFGHFRCVRTHNSLPFTNERQPLVVGIGGF